MAVLSRLLRRLEVDGIPGAGRWASVSLVDSVGTGMTTPITLLYFSQVLHLPIPSVSLGLAIAGTTALCLNQFGGVIIDRFGARTALVAFWVLAALAFGGYALVRSWAGFVVLTTLALTSGYAGKAGKQAFLAELAGGQKPANLMAFQRVVRNVGFSVGGLLASLALAIGGAAYTAVVVGDALTYLIAVVLVATIPTPDRQAGTRARAVTPRPSGSYRMVLADRRYVALAALDFLISFQNTSLTAALPLWVITHTTAPRTLVGLLLVLNTILVVFGQVRVNRMVRGVAGTARLYTWSAVLFGLAAAAYLLAGRQEAVVAILCLVVGMVLHSITELYVATAEWLVSVELADPAHRGRYLTVFWSGNSLQQAIGPSVITGLLTVGSVALWPVVAALLGAGSLTSAWIVRRSSASDDAVATRS